VSDPSPREELESRLAALCAAVEIESPDAFSFAGRRLVAPPEAVPTGSPVPPPHPAVQLLQLQIYEHGYTRPFTGAVEEEAATLPDPAYTEALAAANAGSDRLDYGWQVQEVDPWGRLTAAKNGSVCTVAPGQYLVHGLEAARPGMLVSILLVKGSAAMQPGFYHAFGAAPDPQEPLAMVRFYLHVRAEGAPRLLAAVTHAFNRYQVPFFFKTLTMPPGYRRADASVLYLRKRFYPIAALLLTEILPALEADLEPAVPLFTKRLAPGLGLAEDPGNGDSFGLSRCRLTSEAIWSAHAAGRDTVGERLAEIERHFAAHGLSLDRPYLNPRSLDRYDLPFPPGRRG